MVFRASPRLPSRLAGFLGDRFAEGDLSTAQAALQRKNCAKGDFGNRRQAVPGNVTCQRVPPASTQSTTCPVKTLRQSLEPGLCGSTPLPGVLGTSPGLDIEPPGRLDDLSEHIHPYLVSPRPVVCVREDWATDVPPT